MQRRRIFYVPGTISLLLLLPLLHEWHQKEQVSRDLRVLEIVVPGPNELLTDPIFDKTGGLPARDYLTLELTGNAVTDKTKLDYAEVRIHEIEIGVDQVHGINIHFTDGAKYGSVVKVVDMMLNRESHTIRWLWEGKNMWFIASPPKTTETRPVELVPFCGTGYMNYPPISPESIEEAPILLFKSFWPVAVGFLCLIGCTAFFILRLRRVLPDAQAAIAAWDCRRGSKKKPYRP